MWLKLSRDPVAVILRLVTSQYLKPPVLATHFNLIVTLLLLRPESRNMLGQKLAVKKKRAILVGCGRQGHTVAPRCPEEKSYSVAGPMLKLAMFRRVFTVLP